MGLSAGLGAGLSGVIVGLWGYPTLSLIAATLSVALGLGALARSGRHTGSFSLLW
jgi:hypothetical protein